MSYFDYFPKRTNYPVSLVNENNTDQVDLYVSFPDFYRQVALIYPKITDGTYFYARQIILDGERPEHFSQRVYGTTNYYWTFFIINDKLRLGESLQWPLSDQSLRRKIETDYSGAAIVSYKARFVKGINPSLTFVKENYIYNKFQFGERVRGQISGVEGTISNIRPEFGQIFVKNVTPTEESLFREGESIIGLTSGETIICNQSTRAQDAVYKYIDPETGRDIDNRNFIITDETLTSSGIGSISFANYIQYQNESMRNIRILKSSSIRSFVDNFRSLLRR